MPTFSDFGKAADTQDRLLSQGVLFSYVYLPVLVLKTNVPSYLLEILGKAIETLVWHGI